MIGWIVTYEHPHKGVGEVIDKVLTAQEYEAGIVAETTYMVLEKGGRVVMVTPDDVVSAKKKG